MTPKAVNLDEQVRAAVRASGLSQAAICRAAGLDQGLLCNFLAGRRRLSVADVGRLADALGMEIVLRPKGRGKER